MCGSQGFDFLCIHCSQWISFTTSLFSGFSEEEEAPRLQICAFVVALPGFNVEGLKTDKGEEYKIVVLTNLAVAAHTFSSSYPHPYKKVQRSVVVATVERAPISGTSASKLENRLRGRSLTKAEYEVMMLLSYGPHRFKDRPTIKAFNTIHGCLKYCQGRSTERASSRDAAGKTQEKKTLQIIHICGFKRNVASA